jgi:hypothetical protein
MNVNMDAFWFKGLMQHLWCIARKERTPNSLKIQLSHTKPNPLIQGHFENK